ncbi:general secretion pathway protein GspM [Opitutaceae bacterium EW11]|nr:general secretion pathway protein GspM [Opitutaceae bacterium EW11]
MKAFFLSRLLREKLLLLGLVAIAAAMWLSSVARRVNTFWMEARVASAELADQKRWLAERGRIEKEAKTAIEHLDPGHTFDAVRLQAELDSIARGAGISKDTSIDDTQVSSGPQFSINSVRFVIRNAEYASLVRFYEELSKRSPYIGIEEFTLVSNRAAPSQLTASLRVSSVEVTR